MTTTEELESPDAGSERLCHCAARRLRLDDVDPNRRVTNLWLFTFFATASVLLASLALPGSRPPLVQLGVSLPAAVSGIMVLRRVVMPLHEFANMGRYGRLLHLRLHGERHIRLFECGRLDAEDSYDQLAARLETLGVRVTQFERELRS